MKKENRNANDRGDGDSRRDALKKFGLTAAAFAAPMIVPSRVLAQKTAKSTVPPPSERLNIGIIGIGGAMNDMMRKLIDIEDIFVTAVCDVDIRRHKAALVDLKRAYWKFKEEFKGAVGTQDHREVTGRDDVDAVVIATPVHWHAAIALDAIRAGKDVLVQSPMTLTLREGQLVEQAARHHGVVVQCVAPLRCEDQLVKACELIRNGYIGQIKEIRVQSKPFAEAEPLPDQAVPPDLDYDRWLGPAPFVHYHSARISGSRVGGWRGFWEYGLRDLGEPGFDRFDLIQWALNTENTGPVEFVPEGVDGEPYALYRYANGIPVKLGHPTENDQEIEFVGTQGNIAVSGKGRLYSDPKEITEIKISPSDVRLPLADVVETSWVENIKTRAKPIVDAAVGHRSSSICQLAAIAERTGRKITWDPVKEEIVGDPLAARMLDRPRRAPYTLV